MTVTEKAEWNLWGWEALGLEKNSGSKAKSLVCWRMETTSKLAVHLSLTKSLCPILVRVSLAEIAVGEFGFLGLRELSRVGHLLLAKGCFLG